MDVRLSSARRAFKNLSVIGFSTVFQTASVFAKGVLLARILGVGEFGLGVILISVTGALDLFADAGIDRFIVQNRFGYRSDMVRTSHAFRVGGSTIVGLGVALLSYPLALIFHAQSLWWPIASTGGVVVLRGFVNMSYKLQQREHRFEAETVIDISRSAADLICTAAIALWTHSFLAVIAGAYANALVQLAISHHRPRIGYSILPRAQLVGLVSRFTTPVYVNASMLFAAMQGDRMIVAAMFSKKELALYAVACTIGQGIAAVTGKVLERFLLPILSPRAAPVATRRRQAGWIGAVMIGGSLVFLVSIATLGPVAVKFVYGSAYSGFRNIVFAAGIFQMIQIQQAWLNSVLVANGSTRVFPKITMMRAAAFPAAILFVSLGMSLIAIPLAFALGAALSLAVSYHAARPLGLVDRRLALASFAIIACSIATATWLGQNGQ